MNYKIYTFKPVKMVAFYSVDLKCIHIFRQFVLIVLFLALVIFTLNERFSFQDKTNITFDLKYLISYNLEQENSVI